MASTEDYALSTIVNVHSDIASNSDILMISDEVTAQIVYVTFAIVCSIISVVGVSANIINIIVFYKQGFNDTIVVSLFTLAIVDMSSLVILAWIGACYNPDLMRLNLPIAPFEVAYLTGGCPKHYFTRVAAWITSLVAIERCCCVLKPMTVKLIFSKRRIVVAIICIFIACLLTLVPLFYATRLGWKFNPDTNRTYIGLIFRQNRFQIDQVSFGSGVSVSLSAFAIITSCTFILGWSLVKQSRWRASAKHIGEVSSSTECSDHQQNKKNVKKHEMSTKDKQAVRTVTFLTAMYVVCLFPYVLNLTLMCIFPDFKKGSKYKNMYEVAWSIAQMCESICSSSNIIVYYRTSTRYKETVAKLFQPIANKLNSKK